MRKEVEAAEVHKQHVQNGEPLSVEIIEKSEVSDDNEQHVQDYEPLSVEMIKEGGYLVRCVKKLRQQRCMSSTCKMANRFPLR